MFVPYTDGWHSIPQRTVLHSLVQFESLDSKYQVHQPQTNYTIPNVEYAQKNALSKPKKTVHY